MAETLDEAMFTFPNLASTDQATLFKPGNTVSDHKVGPEDSEDSDSDEQSGPSELTANGECPTYACMSCKMALLNGFLKNPNLGAADNATMTAQRNELALRLVLGVVTNLGCQYRRGEALENNSEWCGLCNLCWQWRKLPSDYYPNYLNEVNCDHNDDGCLSGFGECKPITRAISVMRKKGDDWVKESVETTTACECQVEIGSSLHGLVVK
uniref:Uncharacterized protein n=1 Tax=Caenorhabditis japonica TaxID=281687 RepID=A0A8R1IJE4_CAEJA